MHACARVRGSSPHGGHVSSSCSRMHGGSAESAPVEKVLAHWCLLRVEGGDEKRRAGMAHGDAFALHNVDTIRQCAEQQVADAVVQKVDLVNVQNATVRLCQQPRLEHRLAGLHRRLDIHSSHRPILRYTKGNGNALPCTWAPRLQVWLPGRPAASGRWEVPKATVRACVRAASRSAHVEGWCL
jgi:hypothetical protein